MIDSDVLTRKIEDGLTYNCFDVFFMSKKMTGHFGLDLITIESISIQLPFD